MRLRGIEFDPCLDASGVRGFFGEGYWFHRVLHLTMGPWFNFDGSTFVAKTTTLDPRYAPPDGNMQINLAYPFGPIERFPRSIWWDWFSGRTLNAVGLAGPGALNLLEHGLVEYRDRPYMISFMAIENGVKDRMLEFADFISLLKPYLSPVVRAKVGLQMNITCPSTGLDTSKLVYDARAMLDLAGELGIPIVVKLNLLASIEDAKAIAKHPACDALCFTNTLPFGALSNAIPWEKLFPTGSPLAHRDESFQGGGYSGRELLSLVAGFSYALREAGVEKPFNVGGGIRNARDVDYLVDHGGLRPGHDSIFFASAAMVRPWQVGPIIDRAWQRLGAPAYASIGSHTEPAEA